MRKSLDRNESAAFFAAASVALAAFCSSCGAGPEKKPQIATAPVSPSNTVATDDAQGETSEIDSAPSQRGSAESPVKLNGALKVVGAKIHNVHGEAISLRGQAFGWDNWWPQYYTADVVKWLRKDWCVDIVRPAMGIEPEGAYLSNPEASTARVVEVVEAAISEGIYVIIDWHSHGLYPAEAVAFFSKMAEKYKDVPNVIYEIYNEPEKQTWPEVAQYAEAVIAAIREHDEDNLIIVGCPEWDQRIDLVAAAPIEGHENIIYAVHFYADTHQQWLRDRVSAALKAGVPVFVSESSGSNAFGQGKINYPEWEKWIEFMDTNKISWLNYSVSDKTGETISVLHPGTSGKGAWKAEDLTESGAYIRGVFRKYCQQ